MKHVFIINDLAKPKEKEILKKKIEQWSKNHETIVHYTQYEKHATFLAKQYTFDKSEKVRIYSCGGDGLLHEIANGIANELHIELAIYPMGTGNDFIKSFPQYTIRQFQELDFYDDPIHMNCDLLRINGEYAINTISFGFDVHVAKYVNEYRKRIPWKGIVPYYLGMLHSLAKPLNEPYTLRLDQEKIAKRDYAFLVLCNGRFYGGGYQPCPQAQINDHQIDVCMIHDVKKRQIVQLSKAYEKGTHVRYREIVSLQKAKIVHVDTENEKVYVNMDGELGAFRNPTIEMVEDGIHLVLPKIKELK